MTLPVVFTANGSQGYNLTNSLRFRASASAYLNRTISSNGSATTFTYSTWVKRGTLGAAQDFGIEARVDGSNNIEMRFDSGDTLSFLAFNGGSFVLNFVTTQVFRDPSAWYHIIIAVDTTQATSTNRVKLYVNGSQITAFSTSTYPSQNATTYMSQTSATHNIGRWPSPTQYFDGYLAEVNFIDGQALTPSSFGATNAQTGVWQPAKYTGTYGTNGFYLPFTDNSALTTSSNAGLGKDFSGNGNYWTTNNISITSGATYDSMTDVPTLTDTNTANYCVLNPINTAGGLTATDGNLNTTSTNNLQQIAGSIGMSSGKWYYEHTIVARGGSAGVGIGASAKANSYIGDAIDQYGYFAINGNKYTNTSGTAYGATYTTGDIIGVAYDADAGSLTFYKNGTSQGVAFTGITGTMFPLVDGRTTGGTSQFALNFGQRPFAYTPPSGFKALNTFNLPTPTIGATASTQANKYMDISLYTGTGSSQSITGLNFQPDWTWIKSRSGATDHGLYDAVRGVQNQLESNTTTAETTETTGLTAFNSNGFTVGALAQLNTSSATYVGWNWKANGSGSSNTDGSITSTVSANTSAGFSICTLTAQASGTGTFGHGLGVAPSLVITKLRASANSWATWHTSIANTQYLLLNTTDAVATAASYWNSTSPTSTVVSLGTAWAGAGTMVAYCFAQIAGYSAFGSYTGNGSSDGPFVFTGFRPAFILIKCSNAAGGWKIYNTSELNYNPINTSLETNDAAAEATSTSFYSDWLSNGFKLRTTYADFNTNGNTYIYMAFAENPFKYSLAR